MAKGKKLSRTSHVSCPQDAYFHTHTHTHKNENKKTKKIKTKKPLEKKNIQSSVKLKIPNVTFFNFATYLNKMTI